MRILKPWYGGEASVMSVDRHVGLFQYMNVIYCTRGCVLATPEPFTQSNSKGGTTGSKDSVINIDYSPAGGCGQQTASKWGLGGEIGPLPRPDNSWRYENNPIVSITKLAIPHGEFESPGR